MDKVLKAVAMYGEFFFNLSLCVVTMFGHGFKNVSLCDEDFKICRN
jgi:hypothetical protein